MTSHAELTDGGTLPHHAIDHALGQLQARIINVMVKTDDVSDPPTDAELDSAFGQPGDLGAGFVGLLDDDAAGADVYLCLSDGSNWWYATLTKAV